MRNILLALLFICGCSFFEKKKQIKFIKQEPQALEVGQTFQYVYVPEESSKIVIDATVYGTIVAIDEEAITVDIVGEVKTQFGSFPLKSTQVIPRELANLDTLVDLREKGTLQLPNALLTWIGVTPEGCDLVKVTNIKEADNIEIQVKFCAQTRNIPVLVAKAFGQIKITFVLVAGSLE